MTSHLPSAPNEEYGAPYLPITTARRNSMTATDTSQNRPLEIPSDLDRSAPHEITEWLATVEDDETVSEDDLARARQAARTALGVDD